MNNTNSNNPLFTSILPLLILYVDNPEEFDVRVKKILEENPELKEWVEKNK